MNTITRSLLSYAQNSAAQPRVELDKSECAPVDRCQHLRASDPNQSITVSVVLKSPKEMPTPQPFHAMSAEEHRQYEATPGQIDTVKQFAKDNGLTVASVQPESRTIKLSGTAATLGKAFGVELHDYKADQGRSFRAYAGKLSMPRNMAGMVEGVFGLTDRPVIRPRARFLNAAGPAGSGNRPKDVPPNGYLPTQVAAMYNFPKGLDGTGQTIGILEFGGGYSQSDLQTYFQKLGIKQPNVSAVSVDGQQNAPGVDTDADGEVALDIEVAGAVAPGANIVVYFAPDTEQGFIDAIHQAAHDTQNNPKTLSVSWGSPEDSTNDPPPTGWSTQGRAAIDSALKDAANLGVNLYVASGDDGSADGTNDGKNHVDFPSASSWAISVGGTQLNSDAQGNRTSEVAWGDGSFGGASGGGVSNIFPTPDFQAGLNIPPSNLPGGGRGVPDVASDAAPETGFDVLVGGSEQPIGGTSAAAPLWAGLTAVLGQGVGQPLGYLNPFFYKNTDTFNDITSGTNGAFSAGPGWDPVTGLGSPDATKLLNALKAQAPAPAPPAPTPAPTGK